MTDVIKREGDAPAGPAGLGGLGGPAGLGGLGVAGDPQAVGEGLANESELVGYLEQGQLVARTERPLPRALLSRQAGVALWALRIFVVVLDAMVIYSFISALAG